MEWMHQNGFRLIGELVPYMARLGGDGNGFRQSRAAGDPGLGRRIRHGGELPHTMTEQQEQMEAMIAENPGVTFVAAHPGEREHFLKHLQRLEKV